MLFAMRAAPDLAIPYLKINFFNRIIFQYDVGTACHSLFLLDIFLSQVLLKIEISGKRYSCFIYVIQCWQCHLVFLVP